MLSVLTVNIGAASPERARLLLDWLARRPEEVLVITETSAGPGTSWLLDRFRHAGFAVIKTPDADGERGSALVSRVRVARDLTAEFAAVSVPCRVSAAVLGTEPAIPVIGVYVPSRDRSAGKTERKQRFIRTLVEACDKLPWDLREHLVLGGDYNVIGRTHRPLHPGFLPFEFGLLEGLRERGLVDAYEHVAPGEHVLGGALRGSSASDEQPGFDIACDAGLGEVGAGDQQDAPVGDGEFGVHLGTRLAPAPSRPVPQLNAVDAGERLVGLVAGQGTARALKGLDDDGDHDPAYCGGAERVG